MIDADEGIEVGRERHSLVGFGSWVSLRQIVDAIEQVAQRAASAHQRLDTARGEHSTTLTQIGATCAEGLTALERKTFNKLGGLATAITLVATQGERHQKDLDVLGRLVGQIMPDRIRERLEQLEQAASHVHELEQRVAYLDQRRAELEELFSIQATEVERQDHAIAALERRVPR